jgi:hypothetical protein
MMMLKPDASTPEAGQVTGGSAATGLISDVRGVIDNATPDRLYGWAWDFGHPAHRVRVLLRLAGETLAETIADGARPDLAKAGIGDGCHAFELPLRAECRDRLQELSIIGLGADGREFQIAFRLPRREPPPPGSSIQRTVEGVIADQRDLRRELAELRDRAVQTPPAEVVEELRTRVAQMELWLTRLDSRIAEVVAPAAPAARGGLDPWQAVLYALLASLSVGALAAAAARWLG